MYIVLGGNGHVGSAVACFLLERKCPVTVVGRDPSKAELWKSHGASYAAVDIHDAEALRAVMRMGRRAFLLNPPAKPSTDTDAEEKRTIGAILAALDGSGLEKVVAESTYGAQAGERLGDLSTLYELEQGLARSSIPAVIQRAAYYYSNWYMALKGADERGVLESFYPEDFALPMVAPEDLGKAAAAFLIDDNSRGLHFVEGPRRYTPANVAAAFAKALGKPVRVIVIPQTQWIEHYRSTGFSAAAADSFARMTERTLSHPSLPANPLRGSTTLEDYIASIVRASG